MNGVKSGFESYLIDLTEKQTISWSELFIKPKLFT